MREVAGGTPATTRETRVLPMEVQERIVIKGVGDVTDEVMAKLKEQRALRILQALKVMDLAAKAGRERFHVGDSEVGGYVGMMIHPEFYHAFGEKWGYDCWKDKEFINHTLKANPQCRVNSRSRNPKVGFRAALASAGSGLASVAKGGTRFSKSYGGK